MVTLTSHEWGYRGLEKEWERNNLTFGIVNLTSLLPQNKIQKIPLMWGTTMINNIHRQYLLYIYIYI